MVGHIEKCNRHEKIPKSNPPSKEWKWIYFDDLLRLFKNSKWGSKWEDPPISQKKKCVFSIFSLCCLPLHSPFSSSITWHANWLDLSTYEPFWKYRWNRRETATLSSKLLLKKKKGPLIFLQFQTKTTLPVSWLHTSKRRVAQGQTGTHPIRTTTIILFNSFL